MTTPDILATDRVVIRGRTCTVETTPFVWSSPFTGAPLPLTVAGDVVTRYRATTTTDSYGNPVYSWTSPSSLAIDGCAVAIAGSFTTGGDVREAVDADYDVFHAASGLVFSAKIIEG